MRPDDTLCRCDEQVPDPLARYAREYAGTLLAGRAADTAHAETAARQAEAAAVALRRPKPEMLVAAAHLHDVGRAPSLARTGFAPVDAAMDLMAMGWPDPVVSLVAHQMQARLIAPVVGAGPEIALISRIQGWPADILDYAILTTDPEGGLRSVDDGLAAVRREQEADARIPARIADERIRRLMRAGYRVRDALA